MGRVVCQKLPVAELVLYFDVWVQKIAKTAKLSVIFWPILTHFCQKMAKLPNFPPFLGNENDGYLLLFSRI